MKDFLLNNCYDNEQDFLEGLNWASNTVKEIADKIAAEKEKMLAEFLEENDLICGSIKVKAELEQAFPNTKVLYSPYVEENLVLAVKKIAYKITD